jgi:hypothetical protein
LFPFLLQSDGSVLAKEAIALPCAPDFFHLHKQKQDIFTCHNNGGWLILLQRPAVLLATLGVVCHGPYLGTGRARAAKPSSGGSDIIAQAAVVGPPSDMLTQVVVKYSQ